MDIYCVLDIKGRYSRLFSFMKGNETWINHLIQTVISYSYIHVNLYISGTTKVFQMQPAELLSV